MKRNVGVLGLAVVAGFACLLGVLGCGETKTVVMEKPNVPAVVMPAAKETTVIVVPGKESPSPSPVILPSPTPPQSVEVRVINTHPASGTAK